MKQIPDDEARAGSLSLYTKGLKKILLFENMANEKK